MAGLKSLVAGLKADAAFARWKQGRYADALRLYAEVLELLEDIPINENRQAHHVHTAVRHCIAALRAYLGVDSLHHRPEYAVIQNQSMVYKTTRSSTSQQYGGCWDKSISGWAQG
jgi:hypothetical protein